LTNPPYPSARHGYPGRAEDQCLGHGPDDRESRQTRFLQCEYYCEVFPWAPGRTGRDLRNGFPRGEGRRQLPGRPRPKHPHLSVVHIVKERRLERKTRRGAIIPQKRVRSTARRRFSVLALARKGCRARAA